LTREELSEQFGEHEISRLSTLELIQFAEEKDLKSILERYKEHAETDIQRMKLDINQLNDEALKHILVNCIYIFVQ
jgi:hypothetical protein